MNDTGQTLGGLTVAELETAHADLLNAALVQKHMGHFQGSLIDAHSGCVCMVGAIDLATYQRPEALPMAGGHLWWRFAASPANVYERNHNRAEACIVVMAQTVVRELCTGCCDHINARPAEPWETVTHYNDKHCVSQQLAVNVLRMGAEYAALRAEQKREELAEFRVPVLT